MSDHFTSSDKWLVLQKFGTVGDMVFCLQAIHAIAAQAPQGRITLACPYPEIVGGLFLDDPAVEQIIRVQRDDFIGRVRNIGVLRKGGYRRSWLLGKNSSFTYILFLSGIKERLGYGYDWLQRITLTRTLYRALPLPVPRGEAEKSWAFLKAQGIPWAPEGKKPVLSAARLQAVRHQYAAYPRPWVALGIGAGRPWRCWPVAHWVTLAKALFSETGTVFLCGGWQDKEKAHAVAAQFGDTPTVVPVIGESLATVSCLFHYIDLFVGNDSGLFNLAAVIEACPVVGLFWASPVLTCHPQMIPVVPEGGMSSMAALSPALVLTTLHRRGLVPVVHLGAL
ncbi:MAG: hypothetical protein LBD66_01135 [Holosporales bacterium]|jgi:heptosyltransferase-2|nr:hypothetical protein [Holosporales bacterium]